MHLQVCTCAPKYRACATHVCACLRVCACTCACAQVSYALALKSMGAVEDRKGKAKKRPIWQSGKFNLEGLVDSVGSSVGELLDHSKKGRKSSEAGAVVSSSAV